MVNDLVNMNNSLDVLKDYYSVDSFKSAIDNKQLQSDKVINEVVSALSSSDIVTEFKKAKKDVNFVLDIDNDIKRKLISGDIKLDKNKAGELFAQIREVDGKFGKKISIKEVTSLANIDPLQISNAIQMKAIEKKLEEIVDTLNVINDRVDQIQIGQQNDRLGLFISGVNLYIESNSIYDPLLKTMLVSQTLKTLSDATSQVTLELQSDLQYLLDKKHLSLGKEALKELDRKMFSINKCFEIIHKASVLRAKIFFERNEQQSMLTVFEEYGRFLKGTVVDNSAKLAELDVNDKLLVGGRWEKNAEVFNSVGELRQNLLGAGLNADKEMMIYG